MLGVNLVGGARGVPARCRGALSGPYVQVQGPELGKQVLAELREVLGRHAYEKEDNDERYEAICPHPSVKEATRPILEAANKMRDQSRGEKDKGHKGRNMHNALAW